MKEILGVVSTEKMNNPTMIIFPKEEYADNKDKIQNIANHIEMMLLNRFVIKYQIFFEDYKQIVHPEYLHEIKLIQSFEKHNPNLQIPSDLIKWCIRIELHKETIIEKDMKLETILLKLNQIYQHIFVVNTVENSDLIVLRVYISNAQFKKVSNINISTIEKFADELMNTTLRGTNNINSTAVSDKIIRSVVNSDGSISKKNTYVIETDGTNMSELFENPYIDIYKTQSDSITEVCELLGIEAGREKLIIELKNMMDSASTKHYLVYGDEMSYTGELTSIEKSGLALREAENILLNMSFSHPLKSLESAAINNDMASVSSCLSSSLMLGRMPNQASNYNNVCINEEFIRDNTKDISSQLDDL
jgi:DNA-directed RNA polymerase beta' subunit